MTSHPLPEFQKIQSSVEIRNQRFAEFWSVYPKKVAKPVAERAFAKLNPTAELLEVMLAVLERQSVHESWTKNFGQFIPHPATWLNQRRWEDLPPPQMVRMSLPDWRQECMTLHHGRCTNVHFHTAMMETKS